MNTIFTTFQIARLCDVDISTVINWIDAGKLKAYKTPGGHRRINRADLLDFLKRYALPVPHVLSLEGVGVVVVVPRKSVRTRLLAVLSERWPELVVGVAANGFAAGHMISEKKPVLVILALEMPGIGALEVCRHIRADQRLKRMKILVLAGARTARPRKDIITAGADAYIIEPYDENELADCIEPLLPG